MRRVTTILVASIIGGLVCWSASAAPPSSDDQDDDDNAPSQHAAAPAPPVAQPTTPASQAAPQPQPAPMAPPPVATIPQAPAPAPVAAAPTPAPTTTAPTTTAPATPAASLRIGPIQPVAPAAPTPVPSTPIVTATSPTSATITMGPATAPSNVSVTPPPAPLPPLPAEAPAAPDPKIAELDARGGQLRIAFNQHLQQLAVLHQQRGTIAANYYTDTGGIKSRLATGSLPGDPALEAKLQRARQSLAALEGNTAQLNGLSNSLTDDSSSALALVRQIHGELDIPGKSTSDRIALAGVEGRITAAQTEIDQSLRNVVNELARENRATEIARNELDSLARQIGTGILESDRGTSFVSGAAQSAPAPQVTAVSSGSRPLIVISRDAADQSYEKKLYAAVQRSPGARFTVQATTPSHASGANRALEASDVQHKADAVVRSLLTFGLPRARIIETSGSDDSLNEPEVQVFAEGTGR